METDQVLFGISVLAALAGSGARVTGYLTDGKTYAGAVRRRRATFAAVLCLHGASISAWCTGEPIGLSIGTFWFIAATSQLPQIKSRRELARKRAAEEEERRAQLDRETQATDELARSLNLPPTPRVDRDS